MLVVVLAPEKGGEAFEPRAWAGPKLVPVEAVPRRPTAFEPPNPSLGLCVELLRIAWLIRKDLSAMQGTFCRK